MRSTAAGSFPHLHLLEANGRRICVSRCHRTPLDNGIGVPSGNTCSAPKQIVSRGSLQRAHCVSSFWTSMIPCIIFSRDGATEGEHSAVRCRPATSACTDEWRSLAVDMQLYNNIVMLAHLACDFLWVYTSMCDEYAACACNTATVGFLSAPTLPQPQ